MGGPGTPVSSGCPSAAGSSLVAGNSWPAPSPTSSGWPSAAGASPVANGCWPTSGSVVSILDGTGASCEPSCRGSFDSSTEHLH